MSFSFTAQRLDKAAYDCSWGREVVVDQVRLRSRFFSWLGTPSLLVVIIALFFIGFVHSTDGLRVFPADSNVSITHSDTSKAAASAEISSSGLHCVGVGSCAIAVLPAGLAFIVEFPRQLTKTWFDRFPSSLSVKGPFRPPRRA